jgi:hypothetical protein
MLPAVTGDPKLSANGKSCFSKVVISGVGSLLRVSRVLSVRTSYSVRCDDNPCLGKAGNMHLERIFRSQVAWAGWDGSIAAPNLVTLEPASHPFDGAKPEQVQG